MVCTHKNDDAQLRKMLAHVAAVISSFAAQLALLLFKTIQNYRLINGVQLDCDELIRSV